jgi:hypothetical protein
MAAHTQVALKVITAAILLLPLIALTELLQPEAVAAALVIIQSLQMEKLVGQVEELGGITHP